MGSKAIKIGLRTSVKNLYPAGYCAGSSHDMVNAASTGVIAGRSIKQNLEMNS